MPQTSSRFFDDLSRLMTDAAGLADGARREAQTFARSQLERMMAGMDLVSREEFEAVREMAARARDENDKLAARIAALEAKLARATPDASAGSSILFAKSVDEKPGQFTIRRKSSRLGRSDSVRLRLGRIASGAEAFVEAVRLRLHRSPASRLIMKESQ